MAGIPKIRQQPLAQLDMHYLFEKYSGDVNDMRKAMLVLTVAIVVCLPVAEVSRKMRGVNNALDHKPKRRQNTVTGRKRQKLPVSIEVGGNSSASYCFYDT
ncbi:hypothetical protein NPIL_446441 [Nephila pilipes]|uniref:Uncharacterized protein n=1 Tax=Nephila pilipes TaxID=299642 RepID=A0A8X6MHA3_NEPPI|nr:hypothetical protein NPIL_446441 [Nephila pilipes]